MANLYVFELLVYSPSLRFQFVFLHIMPIYSRDSHWQICFNNSIPTFKLQLIQFFLKIPNIPLYSRSGSNSMVPNIPLNSKNFTHSLNSRTDSTTTFVRFSATTFQQRMSSSRRSHSPQSKHLFFGRPLASLYHRID